MAKVDIPFMFDFVGMIDRETGVHHTILLDWLTLDIEEYHGGDLDSAATWVTAGQTHRIIWHHNRHYCLAEDRQRLSWHDFARLRADWKDLSGNFGRSYDRHSGGPARRTVERLFSPNAACLLHRVMPVAEVKIANDLYNNRLQRIAEVEAWSKRLILVDGEPWVECAEPVIQVAWGRELIKLKALVPVIGSRPCDQDYFRFDRLQDTIEYCRDRYTTPLDLDLDIKVFIPDSFTIEDDYDALYRSAKSLFEHGYRHLEHMNGAEGSDWFILKDAVGKSHSIATNPEALVGAMTRFAATLARLPIERPTHTLTAVREAIDRWNLRPTDHIRSGTAMPSK
jgi:hypothetical protein